MGKCTVAVTIRSFDYDGQGMAKPRGHCRIGYINETGERMGEGTSSFISGGCGESSRELSGSARGSSRGLLPSGSSQGSGWTSSTWMPHASTVSASSPRRMLASGQ